MSEHCCPRMVDAVADPDIPISYSAKFREYGIRILDGGSSVLGITHCPWGGCELPNSLRDTWFDAIEGMGFEPDDPAIPAEYQSDAWWRARDA